MNSENERIEYKREYVDDIAKEVIAFANTDGGEIYVGVNDDGTPAPLANTDDTYKWLLYKNIYNIDTIRSCMGFKIIDHIFS